MDYGSDRNGRAPKAVFAAASVVCSALLFYFGTGLTPLPALAWLAAIPVLVLAPRVSAKAGATTAFLAYLMGTANQWAYYLHSQDMPLPAGITVSVVGAVMFALAVVLFRALLRRSHVFLACVVTPALWTGALYVVSLISPSGVMGTLAWSEADVPVVLQISSVTGLWGVEFLVLLAGSAVAAVLAPGVLTAARLRTGLLTVAVFGLVLGAGAARLSSETETAHTERVALISTNKGHWGTDVASGEGQALIRSYVDQIAALPDGVSTVVLPEAPFGADRASLPKLLGPMADAARASGSDVVVGVIRHDKGAKFNAALAFPRDGGPHTEYHKWNNGTARNVRPGHELGFVPGTGTRAGIQICMDINFGTPSRDYARAGSRIMFMPASDEGVNGKQHSRSALLRGVENGFSVAWSGQRGTLTVTDGYGRVLAERSTGGPAPLSTLVADVPMGPGATLYSRFGDWFAWLCLALTAGGLLTVAVRRPARRPQSGDPAVREPVSRP